MTVRWPAASALFLCLSAAAEEPTQLTPADKEKIAAQIAQLGNEDFDARTKAAGELRKWDARAVPLLRAALEKAADLETAGRLKALLARQETRSALKKLAAAYNNDPDRMMTESRVSLAKNKKATRESQTLMRLAAAIYQRRIKTETDDNRRQRATMMAQMCEQLAAVSVWNKNLPADIDDKEIKQAADEFAAELLAEEKK